MQSYCLVGTELLFGMRTFWGWMVVMLVQQRGCPRCHWIVCWEMVKTVNMLCLFWHNFKKSAAHKSKANTALWTLVFHEFKQLQTQPPPRWKVPLSETLWYWGPGKVSTEPQIFPPASLSCFTAVFWDAPAATSSSQEPLLQTPGSGADTTVEPTYLVGILMSLLLRKSCILLRASPVIVNAHQHDYGH